MEGELQEFKASWLHYILTRVMCINNCILCSTLEILLNKLYKEVTTNMS